MAFNHSVTLSYVHVTWKEEEKMVFYRNFVIENLTKHPSNLETLFAVGENVQSRSVCM